MACGVEHSCGEPLFYSCEQKKSTEDPRLKISSAFFRLRSFFKTLFQARSSYRHQSRRGDYRVLSSVAMSDLFSIRNQLYLGNYQQACVLTHEPHIRLSASSRSSVCPPYLLPACRW